MISFSDSDETESTDDILGMKTAVNRTVSYDGMCPKDSVKQPQVDFKINTAKVYI